MSYDIIILNTIDVGLQTGRRRRRSAKKNNTRYSLAYTSCYYRVVAFQPTTSRGHGRGGGIGPAAATFSSAAVAVSTRL